MLINRIWKSLARVSTNSLPRMYTYLMIYSQYITTTFFVLSNSNIAEISRSAATGSNSILQSPPSKSSLSPITSLKKSPNSAERLDVFNKVNNLIANRNEGRLFAVVHLCGKQFKITAGDIILVEGYWPPTTGDKISLDKV